MHSKIIFRICIGIFVLWAAWGVFSLFVSRESGEEMGLLGQMSFYFILPSLIWLFVAYWLIKHFSIDDLKRHITESSIHRKKMEEQLEEISKKIK